ncbi:MAG: glycerophosphodiester phosphodiesterase family protein [Oricola sp.]
MARLDPVQALGIQLVCHRGANRFAPENTLAAARLSFEQGADYVELDVRESADGELMVIHDPTVERTTDGSGRVDSMTAGQLRALDAGSRFSPHFRGERIPLLGEMIDLARSYGRKLYIENKSVDGNRLARFVEGMGFLGDCFFWSGNPALQDSMRAASATAQIKVRIMARHCDYPSTDALKSHLNPSVAEILFERYDVLAEACIRAGMTPMLQYFGDDPAVFDRIAALRPPLINLDRADLLLAACRRGDHAWK